MLEYIVDRSVRHRWLVLLAVAALAAFGAFNYTRLMAVKNGGSWM
jgi:Cu/Ag efflux pump CusA